MLRVYCARERAGVTMPARQPPRYDDYAAADECCCRAAYFVAQPPRAAYHDCRDNIWPHCHDAYFTMSAIATLLHTPMLTKRHCFIDFRQRERCYAMLLIASAWLRHTLFAAMPLDMPLLRYADIAIACR